MPLDPLQRSVDDRVRLQHMLEAAHHAVLFVTGRVRADLDSDPMLRRALVNALQEIGEAAARIGDESRLRVAGVPWGSIVAMRHVLVHVYWGVDRDRTWKTANEDVPVLIGALESALAGWPLPGE